MDRNPYTAVRKDFVEVQFDDLASICIPQFRTQAIDTESNGKVFSCTTMIGKEVYLSSIDITMDEIHRSILGE